MRTIVIAWADKTGLQETDELELFDGVNWRRKHKVIPEGKACVWLNKGTADDIVKAGQYVADNMADKGHLKMAVYDFPVDETDPLGFAKKLIMQGL
jgi:hypothetical protein